MSMATRSLSSGVAGSIVVANADGRLLPKITVNGGTLSTTRYNQIGTITLNGATFRDWRFR